MTVEVQRENNMQKMREALETMINLFEQGVICTSYANSAEEMEQIEELYHKTKSAIADPPRNCDIGAADEQYKRFRDYCYSKRCESLISKNTLGSEVAFNWAQMPYEQEMGEKKGGAE